MSLKLLFLSSESIPAIHPVSADTSLCCPVLLKCWVTSTRRLRSKRGALRTTCHRARLLRRRGGLDISPFLYHRAVGEQGIPVWPAGFIQRSEESVRSTSHSSHCFIHLTIQDLRPDSDLKWPETWLGLTCAWLSFSGLILLILF